jgi:AcrR family transcriptional regulator
MPDARPVNMRRHGWAGDLPADDDEAVRRILAATRTCIDRKGDDTGVADVARELGVSRQTVYRYFRTTDDLLTASAIDAAAEFLGRLELHLGTRRREPAEAVVEAIAYTLEQLPFEPYLRLLLTPGRISIYSQGFTSDTALALGRAIIDRFPVDWAAHGFDDGGLDQLVEQMLRTTLSYVIDPGHPARTGRDLRNDLDAWLGAAVAARGRTPRRS